MKRGGVWSGINIRSFLVVLYENGRFKEALTKPVVFSEDNWSNAENDSFSEAYSFTSFIYFEPGGHELEDMVLLFQGTIFDKKRKKNDTFESKNTI